jgi:putative DNA-invertase from lambdoid prophage Rac
VRRQAAYLRVSTTQQDEALQREAIQRAAGARGEPVDLWFSEKLGGNGLERPELDSIRALARRGELSHLWVFRLDRLARGAYHLLSVVVELKKHGCKIVSVTEPLDFDGALGQAMMAMLGAAAEIELEALRDRTRAARRKAESAGKRWGRPPAGSEVERNLLRSLVVDSGLTLRKAAKEAGLTYGTAQRIMASNGQPKKAND